MIQTDCAHFQDMLDDFRRGMLPDEVNAAVLAHLDSCDACREELEFRNELAEQLRSTLPVVPEKKYHLSAELKQAISEMSVGDVDRKPRSPLLPWMLAAAIVIIGVVGFYGMDKDVTNQLPTGSSRQISMAVESAENNAAEPVSPAAPMRIRRGIPASNQPASTMPASEAATGSGLKQEFADTVASARTASANENARMAETKQADGNAMGYAADRPMPAATARPADNEKLTLYAKLPPAATLPAQDDAASGLSSAAPTMATSTDLSAEAPALAAAPAAAPPPAMKAARPLDNTYYRESSETGRATSFRATSPRAAKLEEKKTVSFRVADEAKTSAIFSATTSTVTSATIMTTGPLTEFTTSGVSLQ